MEALFPLQFAAKSMGNESVSVVEVLSAEIAILSEVDDDHERPYAVLTVTVAGGGDDGRSKRSAADSMDSVVRCKGTKETEVEIAITRRLRSVDIVEEKGSSKMTRPRSISPDIECDGNEAMDRQIGWISTGWNAAESAFDGAASSRFEIEFLTKSEFEAMRSLCFSAMLEVEMELEIFYVNFC